MKIYIQISIETILFFMPLLDSHNVCLKNQQAAQAAGKTLPDATQPVGKIHLFSKIAVFTILAQKWLNIPAQIFLGGSVPRLLIGPWAQRFNHSIEADDILY